jgi:hypothetical protein
MRKVNENVPSAAGKRSQLLKLTMKTSYLLPHRLLPMGLVLLAICLPLGLWYLFTFEDFPWHLRIQIPWDDKGDNGLLSLVDGGMLHLDIIDELLALGCLVGFIMTGFSRLAVEDERTAQMRLAALQWGLYVNYIILALCVVFIHGTLFISVMIYNMFTPLVIFVVKFHWALYREKGMDLSKEGLLI